MYNITLGHTHKDRPTVSSPSKSSPKKGIKREVYSGANQFGKVRQVFFFMIYIFRGRLEGVSCARILDVCLKQSLLTFISVHVVKSLCMLGRQGPDPSAGGTLLQVPMAQGAGWRTSGQAQPASLESLNFTLDCSML